MVCIVVVKLSLIAAASLACEISYGIAAGDAAITLAKKFMAAGMLRRNTRHQGEPPAADIAARHHFTQLFSSATILRRLIIMAGAASDPGEAATSAPHR